MRLPILLLICTFSIQSFAQTDIIEMRSRNATLDTYIKTNETDKIDHACSNFGLVPSLERGIKLADMLPPNIYLDSVKNIKEKGVVFFTRQQCEKRFLTDSAIRQLPCPTFADTFPEIVLQPNSSLDSFKTVLQSSYFFTYQMDSTKFIDFSERPEIQSEEMMPKEKSEKENTIGWELLFMISTPILFFFALNKWVFKRLIITKSE